MKIIIVDVNQVLKRKKKLVINVITHVKNTRLIHAIANNVNSGILF